MNATPLPGLILAGGQSRRMGTDKTLLPLAGRPLIDHVTGILEPQVAALWINAPTDYAHDGGLALVPDTLPGQLGPLAGILAGMRYAASTLPNSRGLVTVAGDTPFLPRDLAARLWTASANGTTIALAASGGRHHPVAAVWPIGLADDLEDWLRDPQNRRVTAFIDRHPHTSVEFAPHASSLGDIDPFFNVNTPDDLARAETYAKALAA